MRGLGKQRYRVRQVTTDAFDHGESAENGEGYGEAAPTSVLTVGVWPMCVRSVGMSSMGMRRMGLHCPVGMRLHRM